MSNNVLRDIRDLRVQVVHPPDDDGESLVDHLRRIGCMVEAVWPIPGAPSGQADILMLAIDFHARDEIRRLLQIARGRRPRADRHRRLRESSHASTRSGIARARRNGEADPAVRPAHQHHPRSHPVAGEAQGAPASREARSASSPAYTNPARQGHPHADPADERGGRAYDHPQAGDGQTNCRWKTIALAIINANELLTTKFSRT